MNKNLFILSAVLFVFVLLSGCVKMDVGMKVNSDGTAQVTTLMDVSGLANASSPFSAMDPDAPDPKIAYSKENICNTLSENQSATPPVSDDSSSVTSLVDTTKSTCEGVDDFIVKYTSNEKTDLVEQGTLVIEEKGNTKIFTLTFKGTGEQTEGESSPDPEQLKAMGLEMNFNIEMPGEIKSTTAGEISDDKKEVSFSLFDLPDGIVIVSEETSSFGFFGIAIETILLVVGVLVILGIIIFAVSRIKGI